MISAKPVSLSPAGLFSLKTKISLCIAVVFWASAFVGIRIGLESYSPGSLALFRFLIASACMGVLYWRMDKRVIFPRKDFCLLLLFGVFGISFYNVFLNYGEVSVAAGTASFMISQSPLMGMVLAVIFLGEKFNPATLFGILISILGVGLIALTQDHDVKFDIGMVYILLATIVSGLHSVMQKFFLKRYHALDVTVFIIWGGTVGLLIYLPELWHDLQAASLKATLAVIYLGIFPAAIAYVAWGYALAAIPVSQCTSFLYFMPVIATLLGWVFLNEVPMLLSLIGGLIALLGVWVANRAFIKGG